MPTTVGTVLGTVNTNYVDLIPPLPSLAVN